MLEKIRIEMGSDWLYISGLVGFYNILNHYEDDIILGDSYIEFDRKVLENFEEKYFGYISYKYKDVLSYYKIISYEGTIEHNEDTDFKDFDKGSLENLDRYIRDVVKKQIKSNSYKSAYELIDSPVDILGLEKELKGIKLKKKETIEDIIPEVRQRYELLKKIIAYLKEDKSKKYVTAKNSMYTVINNSWNGVCFLNSQTKEKDMYIDYKNYFLEPVEEYMDLDREKFKYTCFSCDRPMKDFQNDLSFLNGIGFDVARKSSHVWDFQNDVAVCPVCRLVYSCVPAGINYIYDKGVYINDNRNMESSIKVNRKLYTELYGLADGSTRLTYKALIESMLDQENRSSNYELADIQLVRYEGESYRFNILSKGALRVIRASRSDLDYLTRASFKEVNTYFNIYELVVDRILNGQNMFSLVQKLLYYKLSTPSNCYFGGFHILKILDINTRFLREVGAMKENEKDIVKFANASGYYLREKYRSKSAEHKLNGINYKLLNALKTNNKDDFMNTVLNCYLYAQLEVPRVFLDVLRDEEDFKTIGYGFITGLIEGRSDGIKKEER